MATKTPTVRSNGSWTFFTWEDVTENDEFGVAPVAGRMTAALVDYRGDFGGATVTMQGSVNGTDFIGLEDIEDAAVSASDVGAAELRFPWPYYRPSAAGGSSQSLTVVLAVQG